MSQDRPVSPSTFWRIRFASSDNFLRHSTGTSQDPVEAGWKLSWCVFNTSWPHVHRGDIMGDEFFRACSIVTASLYVRSLTQEKLASHRRSRKFLVKRPFNRDCTPLNDRKLVVIDSGRTAIPIFCSVPLAATSSFFVYAQQLVSVSSLRFAPAIMRQWSLWIFLIASDWNIQVKTMELELLCSLR